MVHMTQRELRLALKAKKAFWSKAAQRYLTKAGQLIILDD